MIYNLTYIYYILKELLTLGSNGKNAEGNEKYID